MLVSSGVSHVAVSTFQTAVSPTLLGLINVSPSYVNPVLGSTAPVAIVVGAGVGVGVGAGVVTGEGVGVSISSPVSWSIIGGLADPLTGPLVVTGADA